MLEAANPLDRAVRVVHVTGRRIPVLPAYEIGRAPETALALDRSVQRQRA